MLCWGRYCSLWRVCRKVLFLDSGGVGRKSATSVGLTTDLVHWLHAGKTVDFLRCASEINRLFPSSALSIFRINRNSFHIILAVSNNCRIFATRISATPLIQAYQGGTFFYRCYAVHQSTADHSGSDFTSSEQRTHNKRCRKGRVRIEKYQLLPLGDICIDYGIDQATYISSPVCL